MALIFRVGAPSHRHAANLASTPKHQTPLHAEPRRALLLNADSFRTLSYFRGSLPPTRASRAPDWPWLSSSGGRVCRSACLVVVQACLVIACRVSDSAWQRHLDEDSGCRLHPQPLSLRPGVTERRPASHRQSAATASQMDENIRHVGGQPRQQPDAQQAFPDGRGGCAIRICSRCRTAAEVHVQVWPEPRQRRGWAAQKQQREQRKQSLQHAAALSASRRRLLDSGPEVCCCPATVQSNVTTVLTDRRAITPGDRCCCGTFSCALLLHLSLTMGAVGACSCALACAGFIWPLPVECARVRKRAAYMARDSLASLLSL